MSHSHMQPIVIAALFTSTLALGLGGATLSASDLATEPKLSDLPSGETVVARVNARNEGLTLTRDLTMKLIDRRGKERIRETRGFRKYFGDEKRTAIFYLSPNNIRDTAFLTYDYPQVDQDDDQWLYLPALRKVRRISASDRGDYFLGTDFTYEDIKKESKIAAEDYRFQTLRADSVDGHAVWVVEATPISEKVAQELGYGKVVLWVDAEIWISRLTEFWDTRGEPLKTTRSLDIRRVDGIWTSHRLEVEQHQTHHRTLFTFSEVKYDTDIDDKVFTEGALRRGL